MCCGRAPRVGTWGDRAVSTSEFRCCGAGFVVLEFALMSCPCLSLSLPSGWDVLSGRGWRVRFAYFHSDYDLWLNSKYESLKGQSIIGYDRNHRVAVTSVKRVFRIAVQWNRMRGMHFDSAKMCRLLGAFSGLRASVLASRALLAVCALFSFSTDHIVTILQ